MAEVVKLRVDPAEAARLRALWADRMPSRPVSIAASQAAQAADLAPGAAAAPQITEDLQRLRLALLPETLMEPILAQVADAFGVPVRAMLGASRRREIVMARWAAIWLGRQAGLTLEEIGRALRMDHTSVMHALAKVQDRLGAADG